ncbi:unnamed protein product [Hymenolepis diminuta]|uniref:Uncharacterized protein n=1 Tax=Hymenolepis diminuta TaxID=6216 RepID=A0A564XYQ7_HYMDI|nr:unnamed protein product [Hymenolepis diminuta]
MLYLVSPVCFCLLICANAYPWMPQDEELHRHHKHYHFRHSDWMFQEEAFNEEYDNGEEVKDYAEEKKSFHDKENKFESCYYEAAIKVSTNGCCCSNFLYAPEYVNLFLHEKSGLEE